VIICGDCGEEKKHYAKGLCSLCYKKMRYWQNPEKYRAQGRANYRKHREKRLAYIREYQEKNKDRVREWARLRQQRYRERHLEKCKKNSLDWHHDNRERALENQRRWKAANPDKLREWDQCNPEKVIAKTARYRAHKRGLPNTLTAEQIERLLIIGQAIYPGQELHLDHIIPISKGGGTTLANMHYIPAHLNLSKGDKLPQEILEQLALCA